LSTTSSTFSFSLTALLTAVLAFLDPIAVLGLAFAVSSNPKSKTAIFLELALLQLPLWQLHLQFLSCNHQYMV